MLFCDKYKITLHHKDTSAYQSAFLLSTVVGRVRHNIAGKFALA